MRVLLTVHDFLPFTWGGTELYTYNVAQILRRKGHEVHLLHAEPGPEFGREERVFDGLPCTVIRKKLDEGYENLFREQDERVDAIFTDVVNRFRPDLVHMNHLVHLSSNIPRLCRSRDIPVVFTLNDFWLHCARFTYLDNNASLCTGPAPEKCAACCRGIYAPPTPWNGSLRARVVRRLRRLLGRPKTAGTDEIGGAKKFRQRAALLADTVAHTDLFIAPSRFLLETMARGGVPRDKMVYCDYGMSSEVRRVERPKPESRRLRFGFVGTISRHKGVHVLLEAFDGLTQAELHLYGDGDGSLRETYAQIIAQGHMHFPGELSSANKSEAYALMDALIVPSVWYADSPLVIHEAFQAGVPVITSNHGGMAELVPPGVGGLQFRVGDAQDLKRTVVELCRRPEELARLRESIPHVKDMDEHYDELMGFYDRVRAAKAEWARA